jgi:hypothetical protein
MRAAYYNPKSIHVSRAEASLNHGVLSIFIDATEYTLRCLFSSRLETNL